MFSGPKSLCRYNDGNDIFFLNVILFEIEDTDGCDCNYNLVIPDKYLTVIGFT